MSQIQYRFALKEELPKIKALLQSCLLPFEDIDDHVNTFIVAINDNQIIGSLGIENYGDNGLLRSFAVAYDHRHTLTCKVLMTKMEEYAKMNQIQKVYLLTTTIDKFLLTAGFAKIDRSEVPHTITATREFMSICPSSAICMYKNVK